MMSSTGRSRRLVLFIVVLLIALGCSGCLGCSGDPALAGSAPASVLRQRFPDQAAQVLEQGEAFVATSEGFALDTPSGQSGWGAVSVTLPRNGQEAIRIRGFGGVEVRVRELGVQGEGVLAERAVAYPRAGGTSFWTAAAGGVEEWLHLEAGAARVGEAVATWEVEEATVRQRGEGVEVVDAVGVVRLSVTAPRAYATGGREVFATLVGSGSRIELHVGAGGEEVLVDPLWLPAGSLSTGRYAHTATLLQDGTVLVVGGEGIAGSLASVERYNPATDTWTAATSMSAGRSDHTATLLQDGTVLVAGGYSGTSLTSAERYNPATDTWTATSSMSAGRYFHTATRLQDGTVLVAGGYAFGSGTSLASTERYNPATGTWTAAASMSDDRYGYTATRLQDGTVLVAGGIGDDGFSLLASAERYNPATDTWTAAAPMSTERSRHTATLPQDGTVLVAGGYDAVGSLASAERYNPATDTWTADAPMSAERFHHTTTLLQDGTVLVAGGVSNNSIILASAELYNPTTDTWTADAPMGAAREAHTATLLQDGKVLVVGGYGGMGAVHLASAELYTFEPVGSPCMQPSDCGLGFCVDGVCCNTACNAGPCDACSIAAGAPSNGTCAMIAGPACDDGNLCTESDTCQAGVCVGGNAVVCTALDTCHVPGQCDPATGVCTNVTKPDTAACDDGDSCTQADDCQAGVCTGANPVVCNAMDECHSAGTCDSTSGICSTPAKPDGAPCVGGECIAGTCVLAPDGGSGSGGSMSGSTSTSSGAGAGSSGDGDDPGGCGCGVSGSPATGGLCVGLGLLLVMRRRRARACSSS